jgi:hypothetical protein
MVFNEGHQMIHTTLWKGIARSLSVMLLVLIAMTASLQGAHTAPPETIVQHLYAYIVNRRPLGIPTGADKAAIWPCLSKRLVQILETAQACEDDYVRKHAGSDEKPAFVWLEMGLFSGDVEMALPTEVVVEGTEHHHETFLVCVRFTYDDSVYDPDRYHASDAAPLFHWHGAAVVIEEDGRFVIDDILVFTEDSTTLAFRLSDVFRGCDGPQWVGDDK